MRPMDLAQFLFYLQYVVQVAANAAVAFYVFPLFKKLRYPFLQLFGFSALLGVFSAVANWTIQRYPIPPNELSWIWCAIQTAGVIDLILYAVSVLLMVRHFVATNAVPIKPEHED